MTFIDSKFPGFACDLLHCHHNVQSKEFEGPSPEHNPATPLKIARLTDKTKSHSLNNLD
jgi:hypothetical protein